MFRCDNMAVVECLKKRSCKDRHLSFLLRELSLAAILHSFTFTAVHIPGIKNKEADALSRFDFQAFFNSAPTANRAPERIHVEMLNYLLFPPWINLGTKNTQQTYSSAQKKFISFCESHGFLHSSGSPCPASEVTILRFIGSLSSSCQASTVRIYLSAVRSLHVMQGYSDPLFGCRRIPLVIKRLRRLKPDSTRKPKMPITPAILLTIKSYLNLSLHDDLMLCAACCTAFFGLLRAAEFTTHPTAICKEKIWH